MNPRKQASKARHQIRWLGRLIGAAYTFLVTEEFLMQPIMLGMKCIELGVKRPMALHQGIMPSMKLVKALVNEVERPETSPRPQPTNDAAWEDGYYVAPDSALPPRLTVRGEEELKDMEEEHYTET